MARELLLHHRQSVGSVASGDATLSFSLIFHSSMLSPIPVRKQFSPIISLFLDRKFIDKPILVKRLSTLNENPGSEMQQEPTLG